MKSIITLMTLVLVLQNTANQNIPEPEFATRPYYLKDGKLENLERLEATVDIKVIALGYGGSSSYYTVFNSKSALRFTKRTLPHFYMKIEGKFEVEDNPMTLAIGEIQKDRRRFKLASSALGGKARDISKSVLRLPLKKVRDGLYEIVIDQDLLPGEYAFMPMTDPNASIVSLAAKPKLCCFGID